jgi:aryl-alcohol dehydrogenase-like predicted oxidoreductase
MTSMAPSRRAALKTLGAAVAFPSLAATRSTPDGPNMKMHTRPIPSSGEPLPVIGCGTYVGFDVEPNTDAYRELPGVLEALFDAGGTVIDSSPMYGRAETTVGELLEASPARERAFVATKVWTSSRERGIEQMKESMARLKTRPIDLMQIHNLVDWRAHLRTLEEWKQQGKIRYLGVTHYTSSAYGQLEAVMREHALDFIQINYSIDEREAEGRQPAFRRWWAAGQVAQPATAGVGSRTGLRELGAGAAQVRPRPPGGDLRHPGHRQGRAHGGQRRRRRRRHAGSRDARADGKRLALTHQ